MKKSMLEGRAARIFAIPVTLLAVVGCVDVPTRSPMGGTPSEDGDPPDVAQATDGMVSDGALPAPPDVGDRDDPEGVDADGGGVADFGPAMDGRADGALPGPDGRPILPRLLERDPVRCPGGGALVPGIEQCFVMHRVPDLPAMRARAAGAVLDDGRVLMAGGHGADGQAAHRETWFFDGEVWAEGPPLALLTADARAVADGQRILVVGGVGEPDAARAVQVVGPAIAARTEAMLVEPRLDGFSVHRLGDGRVVVVGGSTPVGVAGAEVILGRAQPPLAPMGVPRRAHAAAIDAEGALWIIGGVDGAGRARFAPEVLRPDGEGWVSVPGPGGWAMVGGAAAASGDGVLFAGGQDPDGFATARAGIYDPIAEAWAPVGGLNTPESELTLASIGDAGAVLSVGAGTVEVFDPIEGAFYQLHGGEPFGRTRPVVLPVDGGVLVLGGEQSGRVLGRGYMARLEPARPSLEEAAEPPERGAGDGD